MTENKPEDTEPVTGSPAEGEPEHRGDLRGQKLNPEELEKMLATMQVVSGGGGMVADGDTVQDKGTVGRALKRLASSKLTPGLLANYAKPQAEADPVAVKMAAQTIYNQLPGVILAKLRSIAAYNGQNRYARRATASILRRYFKAKMVNARTYANRKKAKAEARINPSDRGPLRRAAEYEAQLAAEALFEKQAQEEAAAIVAEVNARAAREATAEGGVTL